MAINCKICPKCGSRDSVKILYGLSSLDMILLEEEGKVKFGGCSIIKGYSPEYYCNNCEDEWHKKDAVYYAYDKIKASNISIGGFFEGYQNFSLDLETGEILIATL